MEVNIFHCIYEKIPKAECRLRRIPESLSHCRNCIQYQILEVLKLIRATS